MAKGKIKEPFARLAALFKKNSLGPWGPRSKNIVAAMERARGGTLEELYKTSFLADSVLTHQEAESFPEIQLQLSKRPCVERMTFFPDAWAAWERNPKTVELSGDAVAQFSLYEGDVESATFDKLPDLFPGCLLIDTKALGRGCLYPGSSIEGVFVFPSVDTGHRVLTLRYVALLGEEIDNATVSFLHLDADTIGEARKRTDARSRQHWDSARGGSIDSESGIGSAVMAVQAYLNEVVDRIIALFLNGVYIAEKTMDGGTCHIMLKTVFEIEEENQSMQA